MIKPNSLGIYMFIRNGVYYDYPFLESLRSAYPIADQIVIAECYSDKDDTYDQLQKFITEEDPQKKITVLRHDWVTHFSQLSAVGNWCIPHLQTQWHWQLQADEVIHEGSYPAIRELLQGAPAQMRRDAMGTDAYSVNYTHFLANYETEFDFCYLKAIRIAKKGSGWWLHGDACQLDRPNKSGVENTPIQVFHYGKVHEGKAGWQKEWDFQQLFKDIGFPDPKMMEMKEKLGEEYCDYVYLFESSIKEGKVRRFHGSHPAVMRDRIAKFQAGGWEQFVSKMKDGLNLDGGIRK